MSPNFYKIYLLILAAFLGCPAGVYAQKKKPVKTIVVPNKDTILVKTDTLKKTTQALPRRVDTVIVIDPKTAKPAAPQQKQPATATAVQRKVDTIIYVDNNKRPTNNATTTTPRKIDTVIVISNGKQKKELLKDIPKSDVVKVVKVPEFCQCVTMNVTAQDTLRFEDYINYSFAFKNNCKERVYINSSCFGYLIFNPNGIPVRRLRKVNFAKQYRYPEYVELRPGEEYMFQFGEDPFFTYDLHQGWQYKFTFTYSNTTLKHRASPNSTYSCSQFRDKTVIVR